MTNPTTNHTDGDSGRRQITHADLLPEAICPAFLMKHIVTQAMDDVIYDDREEPGDGHFWCSKTCNCVGPDDELATPGSCLPDRSCYDGPRL